MTDLIQSPEDEAAAFLREATSGDVNDPLVAIFSGVRREVLDAMHNWPPYNSAHEGFAVLHEEFDELKAHVWMNQKKRDIEAMRKEALQVAAVAIRFAHDICNEERGRK